MIEVVAYVAMLLFADNRDAATAMSKSCGGCGDSSPKSGWGRKGGSFFILGLAVFMT